MSDRISPHDLDAERALLGAILSNGDRLVDVADRVTPAEFFRQAHAETFAAIVALADAGKPIDPVTLKAALGPKGLEDVGGLAYLAGLADVGRGANVVHYAAIVRDRATRRRLQALADQAIQDAGSAELEASAALERAESALYQLGTAQQSGEAVAADRVVDETYKLVTQWVETKGKVIGVGSGFPDLDKLTRGFRPGNLILLAARPAMGKTALALNLASHAAIDAEIATLFYSLEMTRAELGIRVLMARGRVDAQSFLAGKGTQAEHDRFAGACAEVGASLLWIDDTSSLSVASLRARARRHAVKYKGLGLIVVDYLQLLEAAPGRRNDNRTVEVGAMSRGLKQLAKELRVPIVALSQLSRAPEARNDGRPQLSDLRESGSLEQDADLVLLLYRKAEYVEGHDPTDAELIVAKHRNGPTGSIRLRWAAESTRFDSVAPDGSYLKGAA